jgi:hypothetical protein
MITKTIRFKNDVALEKAVKIAEGTVLSFNQWVEQLVYKEVQKQEFLSKHN